MENITLCGASWYEQKYYFNPAFDKLPKSVKDELQIMCVEFTEDVGGVLTKIKELQREKRELMEQLSLFYRLIVLGEKP